MLAGIGCNAYQGIRRSQAVRFLDNDKFLCNFRSLSFVPNFDLYQKSFDITDTQWNQLEQYANLLHDWNTKVNLVSRKDIDFVCEKHIIPCLSIQKCHSFKINESVIDVGSGGGLPGLVLAIVNPHAKFTLLDSNKRKCKVNSEIFQQLGLKNVNVVADRAENHQLQYDIIVARSVANLPKFLSFSSHLLRSSVEDNTKYSDAYGNGLYYIKGGDFREELARTGINHAHLLPVERLIDGIQSDKFVLHIPSNELNRH
jgi:16S rRNA (guanine527-N7)-methyltransferase